MRLDCLGILIYKEQKSQQMKMRRWVWGKGGQSEVMSQNLGWESFKKPGVARSTNGAEKLD